MHAVMTLAIGIGLVAGGAPALAVGTPAQTVAAPARAGAASPRTVATQSTPKRPCGDYALVLENAESADLYDLNADGWHCSGPLVPPPGGSYPVLYADNTRSCTPTVATKYFAGGAASGFSAWLSTNSRQNRYTATVSVQNGDGPLAKTFRYDKNDRFYLNFGNASAVGGSRLVTLKTFEKSLAAAALSPYFHPIRLDALYSRTTASSSVFSLYTAPDESPSINDVATLRSGKVTRAGNIRVTLNLTCPRADSFTASMLALTVGSGAPDDILSSNRGSETTGTCTGRRQTIRLLLITQPIEGVLYPAPHNCSPEYGVNISGPAQVNGAPRWTVDFDRGGADGGSDGPGPALCLT